MVGIDPIMVPDDHFRATRLLTKPLQFLNRDIAGQYKPRTGLGKCPLDVLVLTVTTFHDLVATSLEGIGPEMLGTASRRSIVRAVQQQDFGRHLPQDCGTYSNAESPLTGQQFPWLRTCQAPAQTLVLCQTEHRGGDLPHAWFATPG